MMGFIEAYQQIKWKNSTWRKRLGISCLIVATFIYVSYILSSTSTSTENLLPMKLPTLQRKYLINTSTCRIPDDDPFNEDVIKFFHKEEYTNCSSIGLLTYIERIDDSFLLKINKSSKSSYSYMDIKCCYSVITRLPRIGKREHDISFSECRYFSDIANITDDFIKVKCTNSLSMEIYSNVHAILNANKLQTYKKRSEWQHQNRLFNVLLIGIDSMSKMNLVRTMPKTYKFLEDGNFLNLRGYTKIGDNTFPNLMAILTGKTSTQVYDYCHPGKHYLDDCDIIWNRYRNIGYVTGYGEDETTISTFNYNRMGFWQPPTTYYYQPYFTASETLKIGYKCGGVYCTGPENTGERLLNIAKDFIINLDDYPKFGLFWMNTFSHDAVNCASSMDDKIEQFLGDIYKYLNDTILIMFSDHGFRFGGIRFTHTGWLEERLPFIYIHLPNSFKLDYPEKYRNFIINTQRLTTPFDLHMTLEDILAMTNSTYKIEPSLACPKCKSLFEEIEENRTCKDAAIDQHWCMCTGHAYISTKTPTVIETAHFIVNKINNYIGNFSESYNCAYYKLNKIISAGMSDLYKNDQDRYVNYFLILLETNPSAMFEATVEACRLNQNQFVFNMLGDISRLDRYADNSFCISDSILKKYCYCDGFFNRLKSAIYKIF